MMPIIRIQMHLSRPLFFNRMKMVFIFILIKTLFSGLFLQISMFLHIYYLT